MYSFGGRKGKVIIVSNLNDEGAGSFREACEAAGPRTIVFNVAGIIIAGSTAPGDGVCIAGNTVELETHDIIIRHMRFRRGATDATDRNDSFGGNPIGNVMIDHVSASWGLDENMSMYRLPNIRVKEPFPHSPLSIESPQAAFERVLASAGATLPKRDAVDDRITQMVRSGIVPPISISPTSAKKAVEVGYAPNWVQELIDSVPKGFITDPSEVGGYPNYQGSPRVDSDLDGMPDEWEKQHGLDPNNAIDAIQDRNGDGYSNIEEYINGTV